VVTSLNHNQAANHGGERKPTDERYDRAHEFMEVCRKLWDSWERDAVVMDREAGVFAAPAKVHRIEHVGRRHGHDATRSSDAGGLVDESPGGRLGAMVATERGGRR
jgi:alkanesulfonate monooxygenase SsuD/methylene tetrahydromethanopterin reductase-like flavin-dependent oxidoreductase (luciferase family)